MNATRTSARTLEGGRMCAACVLCEAELRILCISRALMFYTIPCSTTVRYPDVAGRSGQSPCQEFPFRGLSSLRAGPVALVLPSAYMLLHDIYIYIYIHTYTHAYVSWVLHYDYNIRGAPDTDALVEMLERKPQFVIAWLIDVPLLLS